MKRVHYDVSQDDNGWLIRCDGRELRRCSSLAEAEAAAFDMARTDRDRGIRAEVKTPPNDLQA